MRYHNFDSNLAVPTDGRLYTMGDRCRFGGALNAAHPASPAHLCDVVPLDVAHAVQGHEACERYRQVVPQAQDLAALRQGGGAPAASGAGQAWSQACGRSDGQP
jgi:hypothetical protein